MKTLNKYYISLILLFLSSEIHTQPIVYTFPGLLEYGISPGELVINNQTNYDNNPNPFSFILRIYAKGTVYNGIKKNNPVGVSRRVASDPEFNLYGGDIRLIPGTCVKINFDDEVSGSYIGNSCKFNIGFGLYVLEFWYPTELDENTIDFSRPMINKIEIDWRNANFRGYNYTGNGGDMLDIRIDVIRPDTIAFKHYPHDGEGVYQDIKNVNKYIKMWELYGVIDTIDRIPYSKGLMFSDSLYNKYPINGKEYYYQGSIFNPPLQENAGDLGLNLEINHNVTTRDTLLENPTNILIPKNGYLKISSGKTFNMKPSVGGSTNLIVQDSSSFFMETSSQLIVGDKNILTLKSKGLIYFVSPSDVPNAEIIIDSSGTFCNEGGKINGVTITYKKSVNPHYFCATVQDVFYNDSTKLVLSDSTVIEIPDSTVLHFSGKESSLIMKPNSKIKFGENSKIVFDSSATFIANGAFFTSLDSAHNWDGIVLNNSDADTITNCTFSNAVTALTIRNDANSSYKNRIITGNTFNIPSGGNCKGIYGENNYRILIKNNTFNMPVYNSIVNPPEIVYVGIYLKNSGTGGSAGKQKKMKKVPIA